MGFLQFFLGFFLPSRGLPVASAIAEVLQEAYLRQVGLNFGLDFFWKYLDQLPSGKRLHNYGMIHHVLAG